MAARISVSTAFVLLVLALGATQLQFNAVEAAQQAQTAQPQQPAMQDMMKMHEQMMAEMKAGDAKLDALVSQMNAATGDARVTAIAAVVNELVAQHKAMHGRMGQMHQQMMGGRGMMILTTGRVPHGTSTAAPDKRPDRRSPSAWLASASG
jgi:hypothetical protein